MRSFLYLACGKGPITLVVWFSVVVNLLMLTGPLFMLQIYDRVLASRSEVTLLSLGIITAFAFVIMGILDHARSRVLARAGARLHEQLEARVLDAGMSRLAHRGYRTAQDGNGMEDLETLQRFVSSPAPFAFLDVPWVPVFAATLFVFHPLLGIVGIASGLVLVCLSIASSWRTGKLRGQWIDATRSTSWQLAEFERAAESLDALGMRDRVLVSGSSERRNSRLVNLLVSDRAGAYTATTRAMRIGLQSAMLGTGAWLAIQGLVSPGVMIAASIVLGRALSPLEQITHHWDALQRARKAWSDLEQLLKENTTRTVPTTLPRPVSSLEARGLAIGPPGARRPLAQNVNFSIPPGTKVALTGPSGAGKSTLLRTLVGLWRPLHGEVLLGGAALAQYDLESRGQYFGWLPQDVALLTGTARDNIARWDPGAPDQAVTDAAAATGAHQLVTSLPGGYDCPVGPGGIPLSGGQRQRLGLARALYGEPAVLVLDEPDAHLDEEGRVALYEVIEKFASNGGSVIVATHNPWLVRLCDWEISVKREGFSVVRTAREGTVRQLAVAPRRKTGSTK